MIVICGLILICIITAIFIYNIKPNYYAIALKHADKDQSPIGYYDIEKGFVGYVLDVNMDGKKGNEFIIPYCQKVNKRHNPTVFNENPGEEYYVAEIYMIMNGEKKKIGSFINLETLTCPSIYMAAKDLFNNKLPVVFMSDNIPEGSDMVSSVEAYSVDEFWPRKQKVVDVKGNIFWVTTRLNLDTMLLPWELILYQFDDKIINYNSFIQDHSEIFYDVGGLTLNMRSVKNSIEKSKLDKFQDKLDKSLKKRWSRR